MIFGRVKGYRPFAKFQSVFYGLLKKQSFRSNSHGFSKDIEAERNRNLLDLQRRPFELLFEEHRDARPTSNFIPLRAHLVRLTGLFARLEGLPSASFSTACYANLHMAASLHGLEVDTDINDNAMWCSNAADFESVRSEIISTFVAGRIAFEMAFHAYEVLGQAYCEKPRSVATQQISRKLMAEDSYRPLQGFDEIVLAAISSFPLGFDVDTQDAKRAVRQSTNLGLGAECLRQFRNALVHGKLVPPEPTVWHDGNDQGSGRQANLFRLQTRLCLLLIQIILDRMVGDELVEDSQDQEFTVRDVVASLHAADLLEDDEDDPEQPVLLGLEEVPRFHYW